MLKIVKFAIIIIIYYKTVVFNALKIVKIAKVEMSVLNVKMDFILTMTNVFKNVLMLIHMQI